MKPSTTVEFVGGPRDGERRFIEPTFEFVVVSLPSIPDPGVAGPGDVPSLDEVRIRHLRYRKTGRRTADGLTIYEFVG